MKKLIVNLMVFLLPVFLVLALLPIGKRQRYLGLKDDCFNHGIWIYDRIYENPAPVDIAILGSSLTINGIDDQLISDSITNGEAVNLGYCRLGRNLSYVLLKELVSQKRPSHLVLEVREEEDRYSHPVFPCLASTGDVLLPNPFFNRDLLSDIRVHLLYKVEIVQDMLYHQMQDVPVSSSLYGWAASEDTATSAFLDSVYRKRTASGRRAYSSFEKNFHGSYARGYLSKIHSLCEKEGIQLVFLYIPTFGNYREPMEYNIYTKYGKVLIPPENIFRNKHYWNDEDHLNRQGAQALSLWLAQTINNQWE